MSSLNIKPTRSELMKLKKRIALAKSGYNLLKRKRDGLILEFFEVLKEAKTLRVELTDSYKAAVDKMNMARMIESDIKLKSISMAVKDKPELDLKQKNIMGVIVPKIESKFAQKGFQSGTQVLVSAEGIEPST